MMVAQEPVKAAIWHSLNTYCFTDAIFLAERLYAEVGNEECLYLLATCYHRAGHTKRTYNILKKKSFSSIHLKYLFATACYTMKNYTEAEFALVGYFNPSANPISNISNEFGSLAGVTLQLLGNIYRKSSLSLKAIDCYKQSLKHNPFLWSSFESLCQMGEKIDTSDYFKTSSSFKIPSHQYPCTLTNNRFNITSPDDILHQYGSHMTENLDPSKALPLLTSTVNNKEKPQIPEQLSNMSRTSTIELDMPPPPATMLGGKTNRTMSKARQRLIGSQPSNSPLTPSFGVLSNDSPLPDASHSPMFITPTVANNNMNALKAPMKAQLKKTNMKGNDSSHLHQSSFGFSSMSAISSPLLTQDSPASDTENQLVVPSLRRSSRLYGGNNSSLREGKRTPRVRFADGNKPIGATTARKTKSRINKANSSQPLTPTTQNIIQASTKISNLAKDDDLLIKDEKPTTNLPSPIQQSSDGLMRLLQEIGKAYQALLLYDCKKAVKLFEDLPIHQQSTCWVMEKIAIAYFETGDLDLAEKAFEKVREYDSYYIDEGMALYSSLLWLQRKESLLSCLAQDLVDHDKESAVSWCAMGNCFSSQKEHDLAIQFLERAIQLNPDLAYAYTLLGHEYVYMEELDKALSCFRTALRHNERHYNAWYGVGMIYYKQEKYQLAEQHYLKALKINPKNSVLLCHLAVAQNDLKKPELALETIRKAAEHNPKNALCKYQKSRILLDLNKPQDAIDELKELKKLVPKDSNIYYLFGKAYQQLGELHLAQMNFSWAMSLEPQGANNLIKEAMNQQRYLNTGSEQSDDDMQEESTVDMTSQHENEIEEDDEDGIMAMDNTAPSF